MPLTSSMAFQAAAAVSATQLRHKLPTISTHRASHFVRRSRRPSLPLPMASAVRAPETVLMDKEVRIPSTIPTDRHHPIKISLRAEAFSGRRRYVVGGVDVPASRERVWAVLTSYAQIEEYMPNIISSTVEHRDGEIFLDQVGLLSKKLGLRSRMVVRVIENTSKWEIAFERVSGRDFSEFVGRYFVREGDDGGVRLDYEMDAVPFPFFPMAMVERKMCKEVPKMLAAVREEAIVGRCVTDER